WSAGLRRPSVARDGNREPPWTGSRRVGAALPTSLVIPANQKPPTSLKPPQLPRMMPQMIINKAGDEVVAMVVPRLPTQRQRMPRSGGGRFQSLGLELLSEEVIRIALIHQQRQPLRRIGNQLTGIPLLPLFPV